MSEAIRMIEDRKKPGTGVCAMMVLVAACLYVASSGPARAVLIRKQIPRTSLSTTFKGLLVRGHPVVFPDDDNWNTL